MINNYIHRESNETSNSCTKYLTLRLKKSTAVIFIPNKYLILIFINIFSTASAS